MISHKKETEEIELVARPGRDDEGRPGGYADDKRVTVKGMTRLVWDSVNRAVIFLRIDGPGELDVHALPVLLAGPNGHAGHSEPTFAFNTPSPVTDSNYDIKGSTALFQYLL